ncbi:MAG: electron transfer flavoprotein subunit beta/FixA family protein [Lachnospiraceae bacterium]
MKIVVCMKQVPASDKVEIDPETGSMIRLNSDTRTNPYDLYALEAALEIKERTGSTVIALTMGPEHAVSMMKDAYSMGADRAVILADRKFAGSDVLATSYTLAQGIRVLEGADLIICGKQTTDGDTAQIGPAIAEHLGIPHSAWVNEICTVSEQEITIRQDLTNSSLLSKMRYPCLITVDKGVNVPRLPSYLMKKKTAEKSIEILRFEDLPDQDLTRYGLIGSPTTVEQMFPPDISTEKYFFEGDSNQKAESLFHSLINLKLL